MFMNNYDTKLLSSDKKLNLAVHVKSCENPVAVCILTHGMCEHKERYYSFMNYLIEHNVNCIIYDHRGHGDSILDQKDLGYFYDESGNAIIEDLNLIVDYAKNLYPTLPCYLFAHSMGTLVSQCFLQKYDTKINGFISCGQPCFNPLAPIASFLAKSISFIKGSHHRSNLMQLLTIKEYDKKIKDDLENSWICTDKEIVIKYNNDPKCHYIFTANGFINLTHLLIHAYTSKRNTTNNPNLPIFYIAGEKDPVIGSKKQFEETQKYLTSFNYKNIKSKLYTNLRHEILNEPNKIEVMNDIITFIKENENL